MMRDPDYSVRLRVARRVPEGMLPAMMRDEDPEVRLEVARRIGLDWLASMAWDENQRVRLHVAQRLCPEKLSPWSGQRLCVRYSSTAGSHRKNSAP